MSDQKKHIVLHTEDLSIGYIQNKKKKTVTSNINLSIEKGKFIALLGKNGIGKSTLLRTISGIEKQISGNIFLNNNNLSRLNSKERANSLSIVSTESLPESQLTVYDIIALGRQPYTNWIDSLKQDDKEKIDWAIRLTEINHLSNRKYSELSDGQLQRVLIARALAQDTEVILLDEPTVHLDIHHTFKTFSLLRDLVHNTQKTIIVSTHEVNLAVQLANEFILLTDDKTFSGTLEELTKDKAFDRIFPKDLFYFDSNLQQFVIKKIGINS